MSVTQALEIRDTTANPAPLGLLGFGMTTVRLNLHNAGCYELNSMILVMGLAYGGTDQVIVATSGSALAAYLAVWGVFTAVMFVGTLRLSRALQVVFGSLTILFFLLAWGNAAGNTGVLRIAGLEGVVCGLSAICTGLAQVPVYSWTVLPPGAMKK